MIGEIVKNVMFVTGSVFAISAAGDILKWSATGEYASTSSNYVGNIIDSVAGIPAKIVETIGHVVVEIVKMVIWFIPGLFGITPP